MSVKSQIQTQCRYMYQSKIVRIYKQTCQLVPFLSTPTQVCSLGAATAQLYLLILISTILTKMLECIRHTSTPHFLTINFCQLFGEVLTISSTSIELERFTSFGAVLHAFVQFLEDGDICFFEDGSPVKSTTTSGGGACAVHVVHAITDLCE